MQKSVMKSSKLMLNNLNLYISLCVHYNVYAYIEIFSLYVTVSSSRR